MARVRSTLRKSEHGQTLVLVALAIVSLLGMAALAIDVVTLYVAHAEAQRAADSAAIAGAKMFVTSGFTSVQGGLTPPVTQADVCQTAGAGSAAAANRQAEAVAGQNQVAGQAAAVQAISCDFTEPKNPRMTVTVQRTGLPTFLARIWSSSPNTVTATATAEAYNPSGLSAPIQLQNVKPWLVPNCDPSTTAPLNTNCGKAFLVRSDSDGSIANNGSFIGETVNFQRTNAGTALTFSAGPPLTSGFYALDVPVSPAPACPSTAGSCGQVGSDDYIDNIACASQVPFSCGQTIGIGSAPSITLLTGANLGTHTREGTRCLIHADNDNTIDGQDIFTASAGNVPPVTITGGTENPNTSLQSVTNISRSDSVVTVPLYNGSKMCLAAGAGCTITTTIVGFLQLGIKETLTGPTRVQAVILNAAGCNPGATNPPVSGGGVSAIPARLITPP